MFTTTENYAKINMDPLALQNIPTCPHCHVAVRAIDYFCFNCGSELHPKPMTLSASKIISVVLGSLIMPPMGIVWGIRYAKEKDPKVKTFGVVMLIVTLLVLITSVIASIQIIQSIESQVNSQLQSIQMF